MQHKSYFIFGAIALIIFFLLAPLGGYGGHNYKFMAAVLGYFLMTFIFLKRASTLKDRVILLILIILPIHFTEFKQTRISFPSTLAHFIGVVFGYLAFISSRQIRIMIVVFLLIGSSWITFKGYSLWLHKVNFGTYSYHVTERVPIFNLKSFSGETFTNNELKNTITVFDFWNTGCGACFKKFPILQQKFDKHSTDVNIQLFAVNIPLKRDTLSQAENVLKKFGYTFPNLIAENSSLADSFRIEAYPTTLVIDGLGNIVYRGDIDNIDEAIVKLK
jgi:thiol-disulfide isomerase/thioredoxin